MSMKLWGLTQQRNCLLAGYCPTAPASSIQRAVLETGRPVLYAPVAQTGRAPGVARHVAGSNPARRNRYNAAAPGATHWPGGSTTKTSGSSGESGDTRGGRVRRREDRAWTAINQTQATVDDVPTWTRDPLSRKA